MKITSMIAIYALFWVMTAFVMLPFGVKTHDEAGIPRVPGQADSAPANFQPGKLARRASVIALAVTALYIANYNFGWLTVSDLDFTAPRSAS